MEVSSIPVLLITANVGSVFEDPSRLLNSWIKEFLNKVALVKPHFLALHLQEVGGKTYEKSMEYVQEFIRLLCESDELSEYNRIRIYLDEDFNSAEHFTALGNLYFVHQSLQTVKIWNFLTHEWESADGKNIHTGNIEAIATKEKSKFPQHFFPECKWSRKGFLRTRWELNCTVIDLVNIHLFHDASNLAACEEFPSVYCKTRRRALVHTLERFHRDNKNGIAPYFVFGDFNFRCDTEGVVKKLTEDLTKHRIQNTKNDSTKMHYKNMEGENVLIVGKKEFTHTEHQTKFKESWLQKFDRELEPLRELLVEYPITFAPTYPYEEEPDMPKNYMSTRCPAWCDRILMNPTARELVVDETFSSSDYNIIGENICMGDHKPTYLSVNLKTLQGTNKYCNCHQQLLLNEHANNLYSNFSSFLLNYHKMITSQIIIPDNFNNLYNNEISLDASIYKYCLYLNRNYVDILIECRNIELKIAKRLNACIENVKLLCKNKSSPGINNNNKHKILLASNIKRAINSTTQSITLDSTKNISNTIYKNNNNRNNDKEIDFINSSSSSQELDNNQKNNNFDGKIINIIENDDDSEQDLKDEQDKQQQYRQQLQQKPRISINVTNIDDGTVNDICMCSLYNITDNDDNFQENPYIDNTGNLKTNLIENDSSETPKICPQCQNIIKFHTNEPQRRLISKRLMLANNIIVNRVDTQFLNTANLLQHHQFESYTPESAESHSPCPEYAEYSIMDDDDDDDDVVDVNNDIIDIVNNDTTTNLNNFIDNDLILKNSQSQLIQNNIDTTTIIQQNKPNISNNIQITEYNDENIIINNEKLNDIKNQEIILQNNIINNKQNTTQATVAPTTTEKRGIVSPIQLKSRLEILQKKSFENFASNDNNIDENNTIIQNINNKELNLNATTATQTTTTTNDKEINVKDNIKNDKFDDKKSCFEKCCAIS